MEANELRVLTLEQIRHQCAVDWDDDDEQLTACGIAAEDAVIDETRRTLDELIVRGYNERTGERVEDVADVPGGVAWFPHRLKSAMLMLTAELFKNREISSEKAQNRVKTYDILTKPYRRLV